MKDKNVILVVDDSPESLRLLTNILSDEGYQVYPADSGKLALASLSVRLPDLILLDIIMPEMDGFEVCRQIKSREETGNIPIIFISSITEVDEHIKGFSLGGVDFITKPFYKEELLRRVHIHIELVRLRMKLEDQLAIQGKDMEKLKRSEERFRIFFEKSPLGIALIEPFTGHIYEVNSVFADIVGRTKEELVLTDWINITHPDDVKEQMDKLDLFNSGKLDRFQMMKRYVRPDGNIVWVNITIVPVELENKYHPYHLYMIEDITKRKEAEDALMRSQADMLARTEEIAQVGSWEWDIARDKVTWSKELFRIFQINPDEGAPSFSEHHKLFERESLLRLKDAVENTLKSGIPYETELRAIRRDGEIRFCLARGHVEIGLDGKTGRLFGSFQDITERKKAEETLREAYLYSRNLMETSLDPLVTISKDGKITDVNKATEKVTGVSRENLIGSDFADYFTEPERARTGYQKVFKDGQITEYPLAICHNSGKITDVIYNASVYRNEQGEVLGVFAAARDITERKKAEEALRESSLYSRNLIETSLDPLVTISKEGRITDVNKAAEKVTGVSRENLIGSDFADYFTDPAMARTGYQKVFKEGHVTEYPLAIHHTSGKITDVLYNASVYRNEQGEVLGVFAAARDITERKKAERERQKLQKHFAQSQKVEALGRLSGGIAHHFNNILGAIMGYTELSIYEIPENDNIQYNLNKILKSVQRAKEMISQILIFSRKNIQKDKVVNVGNVIKGAISLLRVTLPFNIEIISSISENSLILGASEHIIQILMNLSTNAIYAMKDEKGILEILLDNVEINEKDIILYDNIKPGPYVRLTVKDTGTGIPPEYLNEIFEPYFTTKDVGEGTGLGLSVVYGIVKGYNGDIKVHSEKGKGSAFYILLPGIIQEDSVITEIPHKLKSVKGTILFVDDEETLVDIGQQILTRLGYKVTSVNSSLEALNIFKNDPNKFDCVITDQTMPEMTGIELAKELLNIKPELPIILCTGIEAFDFDVKSIGIKDILYKPIGIKNMAYMLNGLIESDDK